MTIQTDAEQVDALKSIVSRWERGKKYGKPGSLFAFSNCPMENRTARSISILVFLCSLRDR